jgi:hypothetical protein
MPVIMPEPSDTLHGIVGMSVSSSSSKFIRLSKLQSAAAHSDGRGESEQADECRRELGGE